MIADDIFLRRAWIIDQINDYPGITLSKLMSKWERSPLSDFGVTTFSRSTYFEDLSKIERMFGIRIKSNQEHGDNGYYIWNKDSVYSYKIQRWMLNVIQTDIVRGESRKLFDRFLLEEFPSENGKLKYILKSMEYSKRIRIKYHRYGRPSKFRDISPYCIKTYKHRFYVLGRTDSGLFYMFSFDRIEEIEILEEEFVMEDDFDAEDFFFYFYGVFITTRAKAPTVVTIRAKEDEMYYLRDVPLHHTQREVRTEKDFSDFELTLYPTADFIGDILQQRHRIEILSPEPVRLQIAWAINAMHCLYYG